jgi:hypothetical protein
MDKRKTVLEHMKIAGYHADTRAFTRLFVENRINRVTADAAYFLGADMRKRGVKCNCLDCKKLTAEKAAAEKAEEEHHEHV